MAKTKSSAVKKSGGTTFIAEATEPCIPVGPTEEPPLPEPKTKTSPPLPEPKTKTKTSLPETPPPPKTIHRNHRFCEPCVEWFQDCEPGYYLITFTWQQGMTVTQTIRAYYDGHNAHY